MGGSGGTLSGTGGTTHKDGGAAGAQGGATDAGAAGGGGAGSGGAGSDGGGGSSGSDDAAIEAVQGDTNPPAPDAPADVPADQAGPEAKLETGPDLGQDTTSDIALDRTPDLMPDSSPDAISCVQKLKENGYALAVKTDSGVQACSECKDNTSPLETACKKMIDCLVSVWPCAQNDLCWNNCMNIAGSGGTVLGACAANLTNKTCSVP